MNDVLENTQAPDNVCTVKCTDVGYLQRNTAEESSELGRLGSIEMVYVGSRQGASLPEEIVCVIESVWKIPPTPIESTPVLSV